MDVVENIAGTDGHRAIHDTIASETCKLTLNIGQHRACEDTDTTADGRIRDGIAVIFSY